nr:MAG TPA: hypothetical protein [Caudoviricetes sp.]
MRSVSDLVSFSYVFLLSNSCLCALFSVPLLIL